MSKSDQSSTSSSSSKSHKKKHHKDHKSHKHKHHHRDREKHHHHRHHDKEKIKSDSSEKKESSSTKAVTPVPSLEGHTSHIADKPSIEHKKHSKETSQSKSLGHKSSSDTKRSDETKDKKHENKLGGSNKDKERKTIIVSEAQQKSGIHTKKENITSYLNKNGSKTPQSKLEKLENSDRKKSFEGKTIINSEMKISSGSHRNSKDKNKADSSSKSKDKVLDLKRTHDGIKVENSPSKIRKLDTSSSEKHSVKSKESSSGSKDSRSRHHSSSKSNKVEHGRPKESHSKSESDKRKSEKSSHSFHSSSKSQSKLESSKSQAKTDSSRLKHMHTGTDFDYRVKQTKKHSSKYGHLMHVDVHPNGGASVVHSYQEEIGQLGPQEVAEFVKEYFEEVYGEEQEGVSKHVMGIVHGAARYLPDLIDHFALLYPTMAVKAGVLGKSDIETMTMAKYQEMVYKNYAYGTFRAGPLLQVSVVGTAQEESGDYLPEFLDMLELNPFLKYVLPWGPVAITAGMSLK